MARRTSARATAALVLLAALAVGRPARAQTADRRAVILTRAFAYDYSLKQRAGNSVVLAVVFKAGAGASEAAAEEWVRSLAPMQSLKVQGLPFQVLKVPHGPELAASLERAGADILVVCPGLEGELAGLRTLSRARKLLTVGSTMASVEEGLTLGVFFEGGKNTVAVNLTAAAAEGVSFSSELLRLARVIK